MALESNPVRILVLYFYKRWNRINSLAIGVIFSVGLKFHELPLNFYGGSQVQSHAEFIFFLHCIIMIITQNVPSLIEYFVWRHCPGQNWSAVHLKNLTMRILPSTVLWTIFPPLFSSALDHSSVTWVPCALCSSEQVWDVRCEGTSIGTLRLRQRKVLKIVPYSLTYNSISIC